MTYAPRLNAFNDSPRSHTSRAEQELVLCCSRTVIEEEESSRIVALLNQPLNWEYAINFARRHSLLPLLFFQLNKIAPDAVPSSYLAQLKKHYQENAARNIVLADELCGILTTLSEANIEAVPYKGPALALAAYGDLSLRRFIDLDVMVRKADVLLAKAVLQDRGYEDDHEWTTAQRSVLIRTQHDFLMRRNEGRLLLELHWEAAAELFASQLQAETFWVRLQTTTINGSTCKAFADEDLLLLLCVHGSRHLWQRLSWVCDIAELLKKRQGLSWKSLLQQARLSGNTRKLLLGLQLARTLYNVALPDEVSSLISADTMLPILERAVADELFSGTEQRAATIREIFEFNIKLREDWKSRWQYCRHVFRPTDGDVSAVALPSFLSFGYYLMRPWRLLRDYSLSSFNRSSNPAVPMDFQDGSASKELFADSESC